MTLEIDIIIGECENNMKWLSGKEGGQDGIKMWLKKS